MTLADELLAVVGTLSDQNKVMPPQTPTLDPTLPKAAVSQTASTPPPAPKEAQGKATEEVTVAPSPQVEVGHLVENWDDTVQPPAVSPSNDVTNLSALAKELGFEGVTTKEELITRVSESKAQKGQPTALPTDLAKAVEIASQGGNYLEYLQVSSVDWSKQDPLTLYENWVFDNLVQKGKTAEEIDAYLDRVDDLDKEMRGVELRNQLVTNQLQRKQSIEHQTQVAQQQFEVSTQKALSQIDDVYGFKLSALQKDSIMRDFTHSPLGRILVSQTNGDFKEALVGMFNLKYGSKIDNFRRQQIKNATKRDLLNEMTNAKITPPGSQPAQPSATIPAINAYLEQLKTQTGL